MKTRNRYCVVPAVSAPTPRALLPTWADPATANSGAALTGLYWETRYWEPREMRIFVAGNEGYSKNIVATSRIQKDYLYVRSWYRKNTESQPNSTRMLTESIGVVASPRAIVACR